MNARHPHITMRFDGLVFDLDGVVYRGDDPVSGAPEALSELRRAGVRTVFCTNNSRTTAEGFVAKLGGMGIEAHRDEIVTSSTVTAETLAARGLAGSRAYVVGEEGIEAALVEAGFPVVDGPPCELVVVGLDGAFTYEAMARASNAVRAGAALVATNSDGQLPTPGGLMPGAGAILASIEVASGVRAEVMGKPHRPMMDAVARRLEGCERIAIVGDRPETDLAGGAARGWTTILVTTGVTPPDRAADAHPSPDVVIGSLTELLD
jgi:HAD superfamily hydrolase (TIGR01457 family)